LEIDPYNYMAYLQSALILVASDPARSVELASKAALLKSDLAPVYLIRGRALLALKRPQEALVDLKKAAALDPTEKTVHYQLALVYRQLGRTREAEEQDSIFESMQKALQQAEASPN
jgi:Flp pilus assembly protein TadD